MKLFIPTILISILFFSCKDSITDSSKRNENYAWWVDAKTGKGSWIPVTVGDRGVKNGSYTLFYFNGNIYEKGKKLNGKNIDTIFSYQLDGTLRNYTFIKPDTEICRYVKNGFVIRYRQNGKIASEGIVENYIPGDQWTEYYRNGIVKLKYNLHKGIGWETGYYESGVVQDSNFHTGKRVLNAKHYYETGKLCSSNEIKSGMFSGYVRTYFESGHIKISAQNIDDKFQGAATVWYDNGKIASTQFYNNGLRDGLQKIFFGSGKLRETVMMKDGKSDGESIEYNEDGRVINDGIFKEGVLIESKIPVTSSKKSLK